MSFNEGVDIDLIDLLHHIMLKWRTVLCCVLIGMIVFGIISYYKKVPALIDESGERVTSEYRKNLETLGAKLSDVEKEEAALAVRAYLDYEKTYADRERLGESAFILQYDALSIPNSSYIYKISDYNDDNVPLQSTVTNVDNIVALYKGAINDRDVIAEIKLANNWEYDDSFVRELYALGKTGLDMMTLWVNAPSKEECEAIIEVLDKKISDTADNVRQQYEHTIERVQCSYYDSYNSDILDKQKAQTDALIGIEKAMQQINSAMTPDQKAYYTALLNAVKEDGKDGNESYNTLLDRIIEMPMTSVMVASKNVSFKYILMGALLGLAISFFIHGSGFIISSRLRTKNDLQGIFNLTILGEVKDESVYNKAFGYVDRYIDSLFEHKACNIHDPESMDIIASSISIGLVKGNINSLFITGTVHDEITQGLINNLISGIDKCVLNKKNIDISTGNSPKQSTLSLEKLSGSESAVLVERVGSSRYADISSLMELCDELHVKILGAVVII